MEQSVFHDPAWYQAIPLVERIAALRISRERAPASTVNADMAKKRVERWRAQPPFTSATVFTQRLALDGLSEADFLYLLGESAEQLSQRLAARPAWLADLACAFARPVASEPLALPVPPGAEKTIGFLNLIAPLIERAREQIRESVAALVEQHADLPFDPRTIEPLLLTNLPRQIIPMLSRVIILELNVARLEETLQGATPEERFQSFLQQLCERDFALSLLQRYPVIAHQLTLRVDDWVASTIEFLQRLCADWGAIRAAFCAGQDAGLLVDLQSGAGDRHRGGRTVTIARFRSGFHVVYKPRSMAVDAHFQELLAWVNARGDHPPFRTLTILNRDTYGWAEWVAAHSCQSLEEVWRFYQRQGGYLALLYALEATDFHYENLIASGEHPVLIDLESLFQARVQGQEVQGISQASLNTLSYSVLRVGLLPQRVWANAESGGVDLSGLANVAGQLTPRGVLYWEGGGTDEARFTRKRVMIDGGQNRPTLDGTEVHVPDYTEAIVAGFTTIYRLLLDQRAVLLADGGPLAPFANDEVRVLLRPTRTYGLLLQESFHPHVLGNALDRDRHFDRLWAAIEHRPYLAPVLPAERADLQRGDIPMFSTRPSSRDLWTSTGEQIADFFDAPGMALVQQRLEQLGADDLARQCWFIRASLTTLFAGEERRLEPRYRLNDQPTSPDRARLLAAACAVGDRLALLALRDEQEVAWIGVTMSYESYWSVVPMSLQLYGGLPGIMLFLAYLGSVSGEERYTELAQATLSTMRRQIAREQSLIKRIGAFDGWGGVIYSLVHVSVLWEQPALLDEAEALVDLLSPMIEQDEHLDVIGGAAGCIRSLLCLYRCRPSERTLRVARLCGEHLLARAQPIESGIGWLTKIPSVGPLTGLAHGAAGIAWALLDLAALTGESRFRAAGLGAIAYERGVFSPEAGNWPDLRKTMVEQSVGGGPSFMTAWCFGATGIGLARLLALPHLDDAAVRSEIDVALRTTLAGGFGYNHSLCHGDLGSLELLLQASQRLDEPLIRAYVGRYTNLVLESIDTYGWLSGIPLDVETPGLMIGLAGIGYGLLRLADPTRVPSVLALASPPTRI